MGRTLLEHYLAGGWVMHPITVCSILALAAIVYKLLQFRSVRFDERDIVARIRGALLNGKMAEALEACERHGGPVARTLQAGLLRHGSSRAEVEAAMETLAVRELGILERYLGLLATVVHLAPLLGFLGTVVGMIVSFGVVYDKGLTDPAPLAEGIYQALYTTAWGLIVACVTLPFHNWFAGRITALSRTMEMAANVLLETFAEMERMGTKG